jgi:hypothetical protein
MSKYFFPDEVMGTRPEVKPPIIYKNVFSEDKFKEIQEVTKAFTLNELEFSRGFGRFNLKAQYNGPAMAMMQEALPLAREIFKSDTLMPTYACYSKYIGERANLVRHKDSNACTYTIDLCISSITDWPIYVDDVSYILQPNEALCFYGEDQLHWREKFPDAGSNVVEMVFLHYAEPDHWFFTQDADFYNNQSDNFKLKYGY